MTKKTYQLEALACPSCAMKIEGMLRKTPGVSEAEVLFASARVKVAYDENIIHPEEIRSRIGKLGYNVLSEK